MEVGNKKYKIDIPEVPASPLPIEYVDQEIEKFFSLEDKLNYFIKFAQIYVPLNMNLTLQDTVVCGVLDLDPEDGQEILSYAMALFSTIYLLDKKPVLAPLLEYCKIIKSIFQFRAQLWDLYKVFDEDEEEIIGLKYQSYVDKIYDNLMFLQQYYEELEPKIYKKNKKLLIK